MEYEVKTTEIFDHWLDSIQDNNHKARIIRRMRKASLGHFGDVKPVSGDDVFEMRFFFGPGYRAYYTVQGKTIIFMLNGGDKGSQKRDIKKAKAIFDELE